MTRVVVADPGHQVPGYDRALAGALAGAGCQVTLATGPLLYFDAGPLPPGVMSTMPFGRLLAGGAAERLQLARRGPARRALRLATYPVELAAFARRLLARPPDVLHLQWSLVPPLEAPVWRRLGRAGVAVVITAHNVLPHERRPWQPRAYRDLYRSAAALVVHSRAARGRLEQLTGPLPVPVVVMPMAADEPPGPLPERAAARRALRLPAAAPIVLFFGHVRPYKGLDLLLSAWPRVRARLPAARLLVAGPVAGGSGPERRLRQQLAAPALAGSVALWAGHVPSAQVDLLFAAADVVALPYRDTDDSAVLQAARGRGRAVVATAVGGLPEALAAGGGLAVRPGDPLALADALIAILGDTARREALEADARAAALAWRWADVARETVALHRRLGAA